MPQVRLALIGALFIATQAALAAGVPVRQGDAFVYPDGTRVRAVDPNGKAGTVQRDGSIRYSDGTVVSHDSASGDTKFSRGDGRVETIPGSAPTRGDNGNFVFSDGTQIRGTDPSGQPGKIMADGTISYADGTRASHDTRSGETKFVSPDGTVRIINGRSGTDKTTRASGTGSRDNNASRDNKATGAARAGNSNAHDNKNTGSSGKTDSGSKNDNNSGKGERPDKADKGDKGDKAGGKDKGRTVQDDGSGGGHGPRISAGGTATNPSPDDARAGGQPKLLKPGTTGPGREPRPGGLARRRRTQAHRSIRRPALKRISR
jgi:hypothetical protein